MNVTRITGLGIIPRFNGHSFDVFSANKEPITISSQFGCVSIPIGVSIEFDDENLYGHLYPSPDFPFTMIVDHVLSTAVTLVNVGPSLTVKPGDRIAHFIVNENKKVELKLINNN